jgi:putative transposase
MIYPLVRELAVDGIPVTVTCRVLKIARQPYYRWLENPITQAELDEAWSAGFSAAERTVWRISSDNGWWSVFGKKKRGKKAKVGAPAHDDLVRRDFTATGPNRVWLTDIERHEALSNRAGVGDLHRWAVAAARS